MTIFQFPCLLGLTNSTPNVSSEIVDIVPNVQNSVSNCQAIELTLGFCFVDLCVGL